VAPEVARELEEGDVLLAHVVENSHRAGILAEQADDAAAGAAELTLQRLSANHWSMKMLLEKLLQNVHQGKDKDITGETQRVLREHQTENLHHREHEGTRRKNTEETGEKPPEETKEEFW
jgi:hypothetical protein